MTINHNLMPGDFVFYNGKQGRVIARGATARKQYVEISFPDSTSIKVYNDDIRKIVRS